MGRFEVAHKSFLLLDEISELEQSLTAKLGQEIKALLDEINQTI